MSKLRKEFAKLSMEKVKNRKVSDEEVEKYLGIYTPINSLKENKEIIISFIEYLKADLAKELKLDNINIASLEKSSIRLIDKRNKIENKYQMYQVEIELPVFSKESEEAFDKLISTDKGNKVHEITRENINIIYCYGGIKESISPQKVGISFGIKII